MRKNKITMGSLFLYMAIFMGVSANSVAGPTATARYYNFFSGNSSCDVRSTGRTGITVNTFDLVSSRYTQVRSQGVVIHRVFTGRTLENRHQPVVTSYWGTYKSELNSSFDKRSFQNYISYYANHQYRSTFSTTVRAFKSYPQQC